MPCLLHPPLPCLHREHVQDPHAPMSSSIGSAAAAALGCLAVVRAWLYFTSTTVPWDASGLVVDDRVRPDLPVPHAPPHHLRRSAKGLPCSNRIRSPCGITAVHRRAAMGHLPPFCGHLWLWVGPPLPRCWLSAAAVPSPAPQRCCRRHRSVHSPHTLLLGGESRCKNQIRG